MSKKKRADSRPPQPPGITRRFQLHLAQMIGIPLMMLVPALALLGVFGETVHSVSASSPQLEMRVEYPTRLRYKMIGSITVSLSNISSQPIPLVQVAFDRAYIEGFSTVTFTPSLHTVTDAAHIMEVSDLQPGETRILSVELQAEEYWSHRGTIRAMPENDGELRATIETITFP